MKKWFRSQVTSQNLIFEARMNFPSMKLSVIITVYSRVEFVEDALLSLENQTVRSDLFEVIIVSNIDLKLSRRYNLDLTISMSDRKTLAGKLVQGISLAKNEIITFLEDDDLYVDDRIQAILNAFDEFNDLTYYHNNSIHFREFSNKHLSIIKHGNYMRNSQIRIIDLYSSSPKENDMKFLGKNQADFNLSSMAFEKNFIMYYANSIAGLRNRYVDTFLFLLASYGQRPFMIDTAIRTLTRVHSSNASASVVSNPLSTMTQRLSDDMICVTDALTEIGIIKGEIVQNWLMERGLDDMMKGASIPRSECMKQMLTLVRVEKMNFIRGDVIRKAMIYLISPKLMYRMLEVFHST